MNLADFTRWKRVTPEWRVQPTGTLPVAFTYLKEILSAAEYDCMVRQFKNGQREIRVENGFIVTSFTPGSVVAEDRPQNAE